MAETANTTHHMPPRNAASEWDKVMDQFELHPNMPAAALHARRLGLSADRLNGVTFWLRDTSENELPQLVFLSEDFHCTVTPTSVRLHSFTPGKVAFDRLGNPQFDQGGVQ